MSIPYVIVGVVYIIGCLSLVLAILLQKKRSAGLGSIAGMGNSSDTYWDKNKKRSMEGSLEKWTKIGGGILFAYSILLCIL